MGDGANKSKVHGRGTLDTASAIIKSKISNGLSPEFLESHAKLDFAGVTDTISGLLFDTFKMGLSKKLGKLLNELDQDDINNIDPELSHLIFQFAEKIGSRTADDWPLPTIRRKKFEESDFIPPALKDIGGQLWKNRVKTKGETPPMFISRVYEQWLGRGLLRPHLKIDPPLYTALYNWLRHNEMPPNFDLPKKNIKHDYSTITAEDIVVWKKVQAYKTRNVSKEK